MAKIGQLKVKGEDKNKGFQKRIPLYFMNAWFESLAKLKLTNFGHLAKISQLQVLVTPWGIYQRNFEIYIYLNEKKTLKIIIIIFYY